MRKLIFRAFLTRLLVVALTSLGIAQASPASAAGTTPQTISVVSLPTVARVNQSFGMSATASSGLPVSISVEGSPITACSASSNSFFSVDAIGTCTLTFEQAGNSTYAAAPTLVFTVTVEGAQQVITPGPSPVIPIGSTGQLSASSSAGLPIQYAVISVGAAICSVNSSGLVTGLAAGTCTILIAAAGLGTIASAQSVYLSVTVTKLTQAPLSLVAPSRLIPGGSGSVSVTGGSGSGSIAISASGDCSFSGNTVIANSSGASCIVSATKASDAQYQAVSASQAITIAPASNDGSGGGADPTTGPGTPQDASGDLIFTLDETATKALKPSLAAKDIQSSTGGLMVFKGRSLLSIEKVFIGDNIAVRIVKSKDGEIELEFPKASLIGLQTVKLKTTSGEKIYEKAVNYLAAPTSLKPVSKTLNGFKVNQKALTKSQQATLKTFVKSVGKYKLVECRGVSATIYMTCKYLKSIYKAGRVKVTKLTIKATSPAAKQVRLVFTR
jgi:hypothetical protein